MLRGKPLKHRAFSARCNTGNGIRPCCGRGQCAGCTPPGARRASLAQPARCAARHWYPWAIAPHATPATGFSGLQAAHRAPTTRRLVPGPLRPCPPASVQKKPIRI